MNRKKSTNCESCSNYIYDDEYGYYVCEADMDEDEYVRFLSHVDFACPYYHSDDEYLIVRRQM